MLGRIAQLVQSTWFTPKGSGVRIPLRPPIQSLLSTVGFFLFKNKLYLYLNYTTENTMKITLSTLVFVLTLSMSAQTIMTQTTTTNTPANNGVNINMNMGDGMNINMNMGNNQQQTTTTQTTIINNNPSVATVVYVSGYNGRVGCTPPVSEQRFSQMINSVKTSPSAMINKE